MKFLISFVFFLCFASFNYFGFRSNAIKTSLDSYRRDDQSDNTSYIKNRTLVLPLDHFSRYNKEVWLSEYLEDDRFFGENSNIIYVFIGVTPIHDMEPKQFLKEGLMYELAQETSGAMFLFQHRFYGPIYTHDDVQFCTSRQAIEDYHLTIQHIRKNNNKYRNAKVVVVGGHYGGSLAVWIKKVYRPDANIVIASSAPLLAKADFPEFFNQVQNNFEKLMPPQCLKLIRDLFDVYERLIATGNITKIENICTTVDMSIKENQQFFYFVKTDQLVTGALGGIASMYSTCGNLFYTSRSLTSLSNPPSVRKRAANFPLKENGCYNYDFQTYLGLVKNSPDFKDSRNWYYQVCNEFGLFPTTSGMEEPFKEKIPLEFYYKLCIELFGQKYSEQSIREEIANTNEFYDGLAINVSKVILSHGDLDPWSRLGLVNTTKLIRCALFMIENESHCSDLITVGPHSSTGLLNARYEEKQLIKKWLGLVK